MSESNIKHVSHWQDFLEDFINRQREVNSGECRDCKSVNSKEMQERGLTVSKHIYYIR